MTDHDFGRFRELIYAHSHIYCADSQRLLFEKKLHARLGASGFDSAEQYYAFLTHPSDEAHRELARLLEQISVNETTFFRIPGHFAGLRERIFPCLFAQAASMPIRIWSAGCATGEEPYSIAMTLLEYVEQQQAASLSAKIFATDLSAAALAYAQQAAYPSRKVQKIPQALLDKYFICNHDFYHVVDAVKQLITFRQFNLVNMAASAYLKHDLIFCRNVLIYFDYAAQLAALRGMLHSLRPGGFLCLGDAESVHTFPEISVMLELHEIQDALIYQKRGDRP